MQHSIARHPLSSQAYYHPAHGQSYMVGDRAPRYPGHAAPARGHPGACHGCL